MALAYMHDLRGRTLGAYRLIEQIGLGGMAIIYKAYDSSLDRYLAIKILPAYLSHDPGFSARFRAEARQVARLRHPNILPIYGYGEEDGLSYFVMDLVEGGTLKDLMGHPMEPTRAAALITQVADALHYAHQQGVVHRDVKPTNVLLLRPDWALLSDFGIARVLEGTAALTRSGAFLGTPHYMAPEQARGEVVTPHFDQYALGIVLYEMLTGTSPFHADTPQAIVYQHVYASLPLPRERNPSISEAMERTILKALAKEPSGRFSDMAAFAVAVRAAAGLPAAIPTPSQGADHVASAPIPTAPEPGEVPASQRSDTLPLAPVVRPIGPPPVSRTRGWIVPTRRLLALGGAVVLLFVLVVTAFAVLGSRGAEADKPVAVRVVAPAGAILPAFQLRTTGGTRVRTVTPTGSTAQLSLLPGRYVLTVSDKTTYLDPAAITIPVGAPQTIRLDALYGHLTLQPAAGRVAVPGFELLGAPTGRDLHGVDSAQAAHGIYVHPGRYTVSLWPGEYASQLPVTLRAGHRTTLNLANLFGHLTVVQLAGAPPSGFDLLDSRTGRARTGADAVRGRQGVFVPVGRYQLHFYYSDVYPDLVGVTIAPDAPSRVNLNTLFTAVRTPAVATDYGVTYSWREGAVGKTLQAQTKARTYYIRAGTYALEVAAHSSSRVVTLHATLGKITTLPAQ